MNKKFLSTGKIAGNEKGALLLSVIVIIVIFAVLGAAILSITSTSIFTQVYSNHATKAYYMAESGFRYATMNIMTISIGGDDCLKCHSSHGKETIRYSAGYGRLPDDTIKVHGKLYNDKDLLDGGSFEITLVPFWFKAESLVDNNLTVSAIAHSSGDPQCDFPEAFPTEDTVVNGGLCVGIGGQYVRYNKAKRPGDGGNGTLTFTVVDPDSISLSVGDDIFPACRVKEDQTLSKDRNLKINTTTGFYAFPNTKSVIKINNKLITYEHVDKDKGELTGLGDVDALDPVVAGLDVKADDIIILSKTLKITSTGRYPDADADANAAVKTLEYYRWVGKPLTVPIVYNTAKPDEDKLLAGGNFHWVGLGDDNKGHNIFSGNGDDKLSNAPGGKFTTCGTNSCHKNLHLPVESLVEKLDGKSGCNKCHFNSHPFNEEDDIWYRFLSGHITGEGKGVEGIEHEKWNYKADKHSHNEYLGKVHDEGYGFNKLGYTTTAYCTGCHSDFHIDQKNAGGDWIRHPSDWVIKDDGEFADAFGAGGSSTGTYDPDVPVARTSLDGGVSNTVTLGSDMVMCLSCHHAHGSPYDDTLRWNTNSRDSSINKCLTCHTQKTSDLHHSESTDCRSCHIMHDGVVGLLKP